MLENTTTNSISARAVDLLTPLGRGQRGLIVAPPRVGKTILLKQIAKAIRMNHPEIVLIILLVDERPEEVTDLQREVDCQIYSSTFDEIADAPRAGGGAGAASGRSGWWSRRRMWCSCSTASRDWRAVIIHSSQGKGRTMSGGVEAKALLKPKTFFGAARNVRGRRQPDDSRDGLDRDRQPNGRSDFRRIQRNGKHGVASRSFAGGEAALSRDPHPAIRRPGARICFIIPRNGSGCSCCAKRWPRFRRSRRWRS